MALDKGAPVKGAELRGAIRAGHEKVLTPEALGFVVELERKFGAERKRLLARRAEVQAKLDGGWKPDFLAETKSVREADWVVGPIGSRIRNARG
jgi:malate synthase